ncbi:MAG: DUF6575 domain-containing protein [Pseudomonadota bacterium]
MQEIVGYPLDNFSINLRDIVDLIYFDGPLLTLFENEYGDSYLYYWCDVNEQCNRWLVFRVTRKTLRFYVTQKLSLRELIANPVDGFLYSIELDDELQCQQCCLIQPQNLPQKYLPAVDSYYDFSKLDPEDTEAKGLLLEKIWDEKHELSDLLTKLFDKPPLEMIDEPSLA